MIKGVFTLCDFPKGYQEFVRLFFIKNKHTGSIYSYSGRLSNGGVWF